MYTYIFIYIYKCIMELELIKGIFHERSLIMKETINGQTQVY